MNEVYVFNISNNFELTLIFKSLEFIERLIYQYTRNLMLFTQLGRGLNC